MFSQECYNILYSTISPTIGAGKTVVGEMALHYAFDNGSNAIYTTPLKALSNQKFGELRKIFGPSNVGKGIYIYIIYMNEK